MKKIIILIFCIQVCQHAFPQGMGWAWAREGSGSGSEEAKHMCMDASGNIFVTGLFTSPSASFGTTVLTNSGTGSTGDFFLAKYAASGTLLWVKSASGNAYDQGMSVCTDPAGNSYVTGSFESSSISFGGITLTNTSSLSDIFVVKYDPSGTVVWAKGYGGTQQDWGNSIAADASGNTFITGTFFSLGVLFDSYGVINSGGNDAFITMLDVNGTAVWTDQIGGSLADEGLCVASDASGNAYLLGTFTSPTLAAYSPNMINAGGSDIFFAKYNSSGTVMLSKRTGGSNNEEFNSLCLNASGDIYMTGYFESSSLNLGAVTINNSVTRSMAVVKYDASGTALWANSYAGNNFSYPTGIYADPAGDVYLSGSFNLPSVAFGSTVLTNTTSTTLNGFLTQLNGTTGSANWGLTVGSAANEEVFDVVTDANGNIFLTGSYSSTLPFGNTTLQAVAAPDLFLAKLCVVPPPPVAVSNVTVCNKASGVLSVLPSSGMTNDWYNSPTGGNLLLAASNSYTASSTGTFYVESKTIYGCSSIRTALTLSVLPGAAVSVTGKTLTASAGTSYAWIECFKDSVLGSQNTQTFVLPYTGHYAAIVTANGCTDTTACNFYSVDIVTGTVTVTGVQHYEQENDVTVYPNPNTGSFTIRSARAGIFILINTSGEIVRRVEFLTDGQQIITEDLAAGIYVLRNLREKTSRKIIVMR
jgi:hypothetical protein